MRELGPQNLPARDPKLLERVAAIGGEPLMRWHRAEVRGLDRVPSGPALYVGNHNGGTSSPDTWIVGTALYRRHGPSAVPRFLIHDLPLAIPGIGELLQRGGAVRAHPGNADRVLAQGHKLFVYPGGDVDALRSWRKRHRVVFGGRRGYVRLALRRRVPIVPVVAAGAHGGLIILHELPGLARLLRSPRWLRLERWPAAISVPWGLTVGPMPPYLPLPTRIRIEILEPIHFLRTGPEAAADEAYVAACARDVEARMQSTLTRLARRRRRRLAAPLRCGRPR